MVICVCKAASEKQVRQAVREGARSVEELAERLDGVGRDCGCCLEELGRLVDETRGESHITSSSERAFEP